MRFTITGKSISDDRLHGHSKTRLSLYPASLLGIGCLFSMGAWAEQAVPEASTKEQGATLETIVVTAQKRAQNAQEVPIAMSAITSEMLRAQHITDLYGLAQALPNTSFSTDNGSAHIAIRGISFNNVIATGAEARVAYYVDGAYISQPNNIPGTFFDIDRVEVLRGPQGTLFGRNAVGGAVNVITRDPTDTLEGYLQGDAGNYSSENLQFGLGGPISDTVSGRIAFNVADHDGYGQNLTSHTGIDDQHARDVRVKLKFKPNEDFNVVLSGDYELDNDHDGYILGGKLLPDVPLAGVALGGLASDPNNMRNTYSDTTTKSYREYSGVGVAANWDLHGGYTLVSLTSYRRGRNWFLTDTDQTSIMLASPSVYGEINSTLSEELRLQKDFDRGHWLVGAYFFREHYEDGSQSELNTILFGGPNYNAFGTAYGGIVNTRALAGFFQGTYDVTSAWSLTLGGRFSSERKALVDEYSTLDLATPFSPNQLCPEPCNAITEASKAPYPNQTTTWNNFSPMGSVQYKFDGNKMVYATISRAFKSGGYNLANTYGSFNPEKLTDYEIGLKSDFLDERLRLNTAVFYYDYKDLQVNRIYGDQIGASLQNAAAARLYGVELEINAAPMDHLRLDLALSAMKSEFTEFLTADPAAPQLGIVNLAGNRLPSAPKYTATVGAEYSVNTPLGQITPRVESDTISDIQFDQYNYPSTNVAGYTRFNAFLRYASPDNGRYYGSLYIKNIGNLTRVSGEIVSQGFFGYDFNSSLIPPRTYGIQVGVKIQ